MRYNRLKGKLLFHRERYFDADEFYDLEISRSKILMYNNNDT